MSDNHNIQTLSVFLHSAYIGTLTSDNAELSFQYDKEYLRQDKAIKLSTSLPLQEDAFSHQVTLPFFSGLLPDEQVRKKLTRYLGISEQNSFALLKEIGGECAGAVSVYPERQSPDISKKADYRILEDKEAYDILSSIDKRPMMVGEDDIRISGAGAQDKLIIALIDGKISIPKGSAPSTHIIKPAIKELEYSVFNEFFCMKLAKALKLPVPEVYVHWLEGEPFYLIERYDRFYDHEKNIIRLHQEDFCQALIIPPELKYENEGGPSLEKCFDLLDSRIERGNMAGVNRLVFLRGVIFNFLIGNGDAHGKNFSLLYDGDSEALAPFYDLMCTLVYSNSYKSKMAMKIAGKYKFKDVYTRHFIALGKTIGLKPDLVESEVRKLSGKILGVANKLKDELNGSPKTASPIYNKIISEFNLPDS
ncbi:MAG: type II toxin-antitoxin system HipA family toxin [Alphaproteobacteria bacterium]